MVVISLSIKKRKTIIWLARIIVFLAPSKFSMHSVLKYHEIKANTIEGVRGVVSNKIP